MNRSLLRTTPYNYFILTGLTVSQSISLSVVLQGFESNIIVCAAALTLVTFLSLYYIAYSTKDNEYNLGNYIFKLMIAETVLSLVFFFFFPARSVLLSVVQCMIVAGYILIDLHLIMNNKNKLIQLDDHIFVSINLYMDIIRLFLKILEILEALNSDKKKKK